MNLWLLITYPRNISPIVQAIAYWDNRDRTKQLWFWTVLGEIFTTVGLIVLGDSETFAMNALFNMLQKYFHDSYNVFTGVWTQFTDNWCRMPLNYQKMYLKLPHTFQGILKLSFMINHLGTRIIITRIKWVQWSETARVNSRRIFIQP